MYPHSSCQAVRMLDGARSKACISLPTLSDAPSAFWAAGCSEVAASCLYTCARADDTQMRFLFVMHTVGPTITGTSFQGPQPQLLRAPFIPFLFGARDDNFTWCKMHWRHRLQQGACSLVDSRRMIERPRSARSVVTYGSAKSRSRSQYHAPNTSCCSTRFSCSSSAASSLYLACGKQTAISAAGRKPSYISTAHASFSPHSLFSFLLPHLCPPSSHHEFDE